MATATSISVVGILLIYLLIMIIATVFVCRDAKKRNMNGGLWGVVAFFGPFLIGVIIYLVCRNPITDLQCSKCGATVEKTQKNCPKCGTELLIKCPECEFPVQRGWQSCPKCGSTFPENFSQPVKTYKKESGVGIIILIIVLAVICLIVVPFVIFSPAKYSYSGYGYEGTNIGMYNITGEELSKNEAIKKWIDKSNDSKKDFHILMSKDSDTCIVYVKDSDYLLQSQYFEMNEMEEANQACIYVNESAYEDLYGYDFFVIEFEIDENTEVVFNFNGKEKKAEVTFSDEDISTASWRD